MKTILITLTLLFIYGTLHSQTEIAKMWTRTHSSSLKDNAFRFASDNSGNIYAAGYRSVTGSAEDTTARMLLIKYSPDGELLWEKVFQSRLGRRTLAYSMILDNSGNVYICGTADSLSISFPRALVVKFSPTGDTLWTRYYGFSLYSWRAVDIKLDNAGGVYSACDLSANGGPNPGTSSFLLKYDTSGTFRFVTGNTVSSALGPAVEVNSAGDIFLGFTKVVGIQAADISIIKYDNTGLSQWTATYNNPNNTMDFIVNLKSDPATGDVFAVSYASVIGTPNEIQTARFSAGVGSLMWVKRFSGTQPNTYNAPTDMVVSPSGDVYICGRFTNTTTNEDGFIVKYNGLNGAELYRKAFTGAGSSTVEGYSSLMLNSSNEPLAFGFNVATKSSFIHKYNNTGAITWKYNFNDSLDIYEEGTSQIIQGNNGQYLTLTNYYNAGSRRVNITKFENIPVNTSTLCKSTNKNTIQGDYILDTINVSGLTNNLVRLELKIDSLPHTHPKDLIIKLVGPTGAVREVFRNSGQNLPSTGLFGTTFSDSASQTIDSASGTYTGYFAPIQPLEFWNSYDPNGKWILMVYDLANQPDSGKLVKWCLKITYQAPVGIQTISNEIPKNFSLSQNYPNPFNPVTNIKFSIPKSENVTLKIYDILGREVAELVNEFKPAGSYVVDFNAANLSSGVYFYRIESSVFTDVKKMVLIK